MVETVTREPQLNKVLVEKGSKYLTFILAEEEYGLEVLKIREIIGYMNITTVPQMPAYVRGVLNLRGQIVPIIDLRAKFGMEIAEVTEETCIIVVEISDGDGKLSTGVVVDRVQEVLDIPCENIQESPEFGSSVNTDFILGMGRIGDSVKILLDIDKVLSSDNLTNFAEITKQATNDKQTSGDESVDTDG